MDTGSFEFSLSVDSSGRLGEAANPVSAPSSAPKSADKPPSSQRLQGLDAGDDSDVRLDFDPGATSPDDEMIVGKPDSDIRIDPVSEVRGGRSGGLAPPPGGDLMETEQIDLDAELRHAEEVSLAKKPRATPVPPKTKATPPPGGPASDASKAKTQLPSPPTPTMLPTTSPFELSEEDIDVGPLMPSSGDSGPQTKPRGPSGLAGGSEFELTLAPDDDGPRTNPLKLGDDEDVDLGGALPPSESPSRAEMSGINLQVPADSGISLEKGAKDSSDDVSFDLTVDEEGASGPKTLRGKLTDSDSEFELTLDEGSSTSLPKAKASGLGSGEQKDIFETDFDIAGGSAEEESGSQAVALDEADTDLESSDFDLAIEDADSGSQVVPLDEETSTMDAPAPKKSKVSKADDLSGVDSYADEELLASEDRPAEQQVEEESAPMSVPAAQAEWGMYPLIMMVPCVLIMIMAMLMSYELVHTMGGYHATSKPTGLLVEAFAGMFTDKEPTAKQ
jgi:hypothetical protein